MFSEFNFLGGDFIVKKIFLSLVLVLALTCCAYAEVTVGILNKANSSEEEYNNAFTNEEMHDKLILSDVYSGNVTPSDLRVRFYDSTVAMQLALNKGEITSMIVPIYAGEYMLKHNPEYTLKGVQLGRIPIASSFGFLEDKAELMERFNKVLADIEYEGELGILLRDYITGPYASNPPVVKFEKFNDAETIKVAVTGDMPPLDYVAADGTPAGFNTALLSEIGKRLHVNIETVNVETGARMPALKSGRVDVIFWVEILGAIKDGHLIRQSDVCEGVIYSKPYYGWSQIFFIGKK